MLAVAYTRNTGGGFKAPSKTIFYLVTRKILETLIDRHPAKLLEFISLEKRCIFLWKLHERETLGTYTKKNTLEKMEMYHT